MTAEDLIRASLSGQGSNVQGGFNNQVGVPQRGFNPMMNQPHFQMHPYPGQMNQPHFQMQPGVFNQQQPNPFAQQGFPPNVFNNQGPPWNT
jgi:hypothetical protein